ncbi:helix-turn-helix domain-containing protein [Amycolatopsis minnesotensis]|uniref:Helix-turn-helix domain-containing protein n=1 Tax=Amycolatopsis minnesotensis TaxID=337894 RepID=A0ABN2RTA4_9PSEU
MVRGARGVPPEQLWTPEDLSDFLRIPEKTLRDWRFKGYGPQWVRMGKHVRYVPKDVMAWVTGLGDSCAA